MHKAYILFFSVTLLMITACDSGAAGEAAKAPDSTAVTANTVAEKPGLSKTDSIELLHFPDPTNQKVYQNVIIKDTAFISQLTSSALAAPVTKNPCAHDYKLYLFRNGDVYKTIYAATSDSCRYLAYVINGVTHFTGLNDSTLALLKKHTKR
ncbi:hypothetical protein [Niastella populi]|uniref:DUF4476 domain-containing protein n=1 Tax=Niastella populi TaxID=550983 RepID=A0A1V9EKX8_9BACT|nr:hypothetical protein [Niastella populi]OQP46594.1 hypothetical protein A4R26_07650 [Niastella populi]